MSDRTRNRVNAAFDDELSSAPVPPSLRALSVRAAIAAPRPRSRQFELISLVAALLVIALVAGVFIGTHLHSSAPSPAGSTVPPAPIASAASAFDQGHGQLVVFGGNKGPGGPTNETWTWDGKYWTLQRPAVSPPAAFQGEMAYDAARRQVVMFGGSRARDTWIWTGSNWEKRHPVHTPTVSNGGLGPAMQFDPISRTVLLYGLGAGATGSTWSWNGSDWKLLPAPSPSGIGRMVSDGGSLLLLLDPNTPSNAVNTATWQWNGSSWQLLSPKVNLPLVGFAAGAYDPEHAQLVVLTSDTWTWDGSTWTRQHPSSQPQSTGYMAFVPSLHEVVSWGDAMASDDNEMFAWDGSNWKLLEPGSVVPSQNNGKGFITTHTTVADAAATVRATVKNTRPVLLPASLPAAGSPWDALLHVSADDFNVTYQSDLRDKQIFFGIMAANPPPATGPNASDTRVRFRNAAPLKFGVAGYADYVVYDTTSPTSQRYLMWLEPGSSTNNMDYNGGVYYFLSATGLTDQEFWLVANSLQ